MNLVLEKYPNVIQWILQKKTETKQKKEIKELSYPLKDDLLTNSTEPTTLENTEREKKVEDLLSKCASTLKKETSPKWILVITHFEESLGSLEKYFPQTYEILYIYHKGDPSKTYQDYGLNVEKEKLKWICLENVGREGHTILHHCLSLLSNESTKKEDFTIFMQAGIEDHLPYIYTGHHFNKYFEHDYVCPTLDWVTNEKRIHHNETNKKLLSQELLQESPLTLKEYYEYILGKSWPLEGKIPVSYHNCFSVKNSRILQHSKSFYIRALSTLNKSNNPEEGHYFERLTRVIYDSSNPIL